MIGSVMIGVVTIGVVTIGFVVTTAVVLVVVGAGVLVVNSTVEPETTCAVHCKFVQQTS